MSSLPADVGIWVLLFCGIVFSGIGLMGLLIFPDTKSRMFTAFRGTAIGLGAVILAVLAYGFTLLRQTGGSLYTDLILRTIVLAVILSAGLWVMYGIIKERTRREQAGCTALPPDVPGTDKKDGE